MNEVSGGLKAVNLLDPEVQECPFSAYRQIREEEPVYRMPQTGYYVVTRYDDLREAIRNPDIFSNELSIRELSPEPLPDEVWDIYRNEGWMPLYILSFSDPPQHTRYRRFVEKAFTAKRVRQLQPYIDNIVGDLIDGFAGNGRVELVREFATPLPMMVIADQLGVPRTDIWKFKEWSDAAVEPVGMMISKERHIECARLTVEFQHYFAAVIEARRAHPQDDIISDLVQPIPGEEPLSLPELFSILEQLLVGGNETTTSAITSAMLVLSRDPELADSLRNDPGRVPKFCEELLRLESPVQGLFRICKADTELGGTHIPAGAVVNLRFGAVNRDPARFPDPDVFDVNRANAGAHMAFGAARHFCVGASLARAEMISSVRQLLVRLGNIRPGQDENDFSHHPSFMLRGLKSLPLEFDPAAIPDGP